MNARGAPHPAAAPSGGLHRFQHAFAQALEPGADPQALPPEIAALVAQPGFAVYRNTVASGCIDALQANYAAVANLVGDEWFRAAAAVYARSHLPATPMMGEYGHDFDRFLAGFEPAATLPYLPAVARLDRCWWEAHAARDEPAADASTLAALTPDELGRTVLHPRASARWAWFDEVPAYSIWHRSRQRGDTLEDIDWRSEGALIVRPHLQVESHALDAAACALLDACAAGVTLAQAAQACLAAHPAVDLPRCLAGLLTAGAFADPVRADTHGDGTRGDGTRTADGSISTANEHSR